MNRLLLSLLLGILCAVSFAAGRPNIVLIFVDDLGYGDLGCYGNSQIQTPNIDRLAMEGQRWTSFYSSGSTCVPSRTGLMSGRHPARLTNQPLSTDRQALLPAMLKRQGYHTAILGKWHLAGYPKDFTTSSMHPLECGFDFHFGTPGSNDVPAPPGKKQTRDVFDKADKFSFPVPLIRGREVVEFPANQELFTKRYAEEAVEWIRTKRDAPFFLYLAHNMPHAPVFASPEFQGKSAGGRYGDVVEEIDWSVGEVMKAIHETGLDEETLVIFTSDNGPWSVFGPHGGSSGPLRGQKSTTWEGGQRVPGIFRWKSRIQPAVVEDIAANLDLYATFAALTGGNEPKDKPGYCSQNISSKLLEGKAGPRKQWLYGNSAFRSGRYKIHTVTQLPTDPVARKRRPATKHDLPLLFDLTNDLGETKDIAAHHPEIVSRLLKEKEAFAKNAADTPAIKAPGGWHWDRPVPGHTRRIDDGLALTIDAGRVWAGKNSRNRLLSKNPAAPRSSATADVELVDPRNKYAQGGMLLHADDDAFVKLVVEHIDGLFYVVVGRELGKERRVLAKIKIPQARSGLRLRLEDGVLLAEYRLQAKSPWKEAAKSEIPAHGKPWRFGIFTQDGNPKNPGTALVRNPRLVADAASRP